MLWLIHMRGWWTHLLRARGRGQWHQARTKVRARLRLVFERVGAQAERLALREGGDPALARLGLGLGSNAKPNPNPDPDLTLTLTLTLTQTLTPTLALTLAPTLYGGASSLGTTKPSSPSSSIPRPPLLPPLASLPLLRASG